VQPGGINMSPILQALARRQQGIPAPMSQQQTSTPSQPQASLSSMPTQVPQGAPTAVGAPTTGALNAGQQAQGPQFDPETRDLAKSLVQRLLKGL
jgi:hypothetical protein